MSLQQIHDFAAKLQIPTPEECDKHASVEYDWYGGRATFYAVWTPQFEGYCARALVMPQWSAGTDYNECFDVYVWHDGEFPTQGGPPSHCFHLCMLEQFAWFARSLQTIKRRHDATADS